MNTLTPETNKIAKTIGSLIANYVHGDISLANLVIQVDAQLDGSRRIERERDEARKESAQHHGEWQRRTRVGYALSDYQSLPHVIERNKAKSKQTL